jgi:hypothetical protein
MSQRHAQAILQFVFLGLHPGNTWSIQQKTKLEKFLSRFVSIQGESMCYSAVLFYQKLSKVINLRDLETDLIQGLGTGDNKLFVVMILHINSCMICTQRMEEI